MKVLLFFLLSQAAFAGDRIGNGGDALVCANVARVPIEMLDTYMSRETLSLTPGLAYIPGDYKDIVMGLLNRLQMVNPTRAEKYRQWFDRFHDEAEILPNMTLIDIPDTGAQVIPEGCELKQIAVQRTVEEMFPGDKRYTISKDLWDQMDEFNKAVLVIHELAYRERLDGFWRTDSRYVRYFTAHVIAKQILETNFQSLAITANLASYDSGSTIVNVRSNISIYYPDRLVNEIEMKNECCKSKEPAVSLSILKNEYLKERMCKHLDFAFSMPESNPLNFDRADFWGCDKAIAAVITVNGIKYDLQYRPSSSVEWSRKDEKYIGRIEKDFEIPDISLKCRKGVDVQLYYKTHQIRCSAGTYQVENIEMI